MVPYSTDGEWIIYGLFFLFFVGLPVGVPLTVGILCGRRPGGRKVLMPLWGFLIGVFLMVVMTFFVDLVEREVSEKDELAYWLGTLSITMVLGALSTCFVCWVLSRRRKRAES